MAHELDWFPQQANVIRPPHLVRPGYSVRPELPQPHSNTRELLYAAGPELNHIDSWKFSGDTGPYSIETTPAPPQGTYVFKSTGTGGGNLGIGLALTFTAKTYVWMSTLFRLNGTLNAAQDVRFLNVSRVGGSDFRFRWKRTSASTFTITLSRGATELINGVVSCDTDAWIGIIAEFDGTNARLWVKGISEGSAAETAKPRLIGPVLNNLTLAASQNMYWRCPALFQSDFMADRPDPELEVFRLDPDGDTADSDWGDEVACGDTARGEFGNWDDYAAGGAPDETFWNCRGAANVVEVSTLTSSSPTLTIEGVIGHIWGQASADTKTVASWLRIVNRGSPDETSEVPLEVFANTVWEPRAAVFNLPPDSGDWTQDKVTALEAGMRVVDTNDASAHIDALALELIAAKSFVDNTWAPRTEPPLPPPRPLEVVGY